MSESDSKPAMPAYAPYKSFIRLIRQLGEQGMPSHIDRSVLSTMSGSQQSSILGSLQYLGLITPQGEATESLRKLVSASGSQFGSALREIVMASYQFIFNNGLDLKTTTTKKVEEKFREQGASGSTVSKSIAFFLACCKDAGIEVSRFVKTPPITLARAPRRQTTTRPTDADEDEEDEGEEPRESQLGGIHPAIAGLLRELPTAGEPWPKPDRERFLAAFTAILNFVYLEDSP